ncbi:hypothetical protein B0H19DRAFT_1189275 [Mycena capillaripes]|nr:hypothetical protein B0H19DRAFT_1189275 [Mycena capillaripes]
MSHCVSDGTGIDEWMRILIEEMRLAQEPLGSSHPFGITPSEIPLILRISADGLARGSKQTRRHMGRRPSPRMTHSPPLCGGQQYSSACSPLLQSVSSSTTTNLFMPSDARRHLPSPYVGNVIYQLVAALDIGTLLLPSGLQRAASEVRRAITYSLHRLPIHERHGVHDWSGHNYVPGQRQRYVWRRLGQGIWICGSLQAHWRAKQSSHAQATRWISGSDDSC